MHFELLDITSGLEQYVKSVCAIELPSEEQPVAIRVLPDGCTELFISYSADSQSIIDSTSYVGSFINCRLTRYADVVMSPGSRYIAICFFPGAVSCFFSVWPGKADLVTDLKTASAEFAENIDDILANCQSREVISLQVQQVLLGTKTFVGVNKRLTIDLIQELQRTPSEIKVATLANKLHVSPRQLNRIFYRVFGVPPKEYLRLRRFVVSLDALKKDKDPLLTSVALESGYYDQAHFIHDYREFSGHSPGSLIRDGSAVY